MLSPADAARFLAKAPSGAPDECWEWTGEVNSRGYGRFTTWSGDVRTRHLAHRVAAHLAGLDVAGLVRHRCDNPPCCNPGHLLPGTQSDNMRDAVERERIDKSGLTVGQASTWPPRPCLRCGTTVTEGRKRYCPPCKQAVKQESWTRSNHKRRGHAA